NGSRRCAPCGPTATAGGGWAPRRATGCANITRGSRRRGWPAPDWGRREAARVHAGRDRYRHPRGAGESVLRRRGLLPLRRAASPVVVGVGTTGRGAVVVLRRPLDDPHRRLRETGDPRQP